jgi:hypothetical protein
VTSVEGHPRIRDAPAPRAYRPNGTPPITSSSFLGYCSYFTLSLHNSHTVHWTYNHHLSPHHILLLYQRRSSTGFTSCRRRPGNLVRRLSCLYFIGGEPIKPPFPLCGSTGKPKGRQLCVLQNVYIGFVLFSLHSARPSLPMTLNDIGYQRYKYYQQGFRSLKRERERFIWMQWGRDYRKRLATKPGTHCVGVYMCR